MISQQQVATRGLNAMTTAAKQLRQVDPNSTDQQVALAHAWIELAREYRCYIWDIGMVAAQHESEEPAGDTPGEE